VRQLNEWLLNDYGLRHVFDLTIGGGHLTAGVYKINGDGLRYLVCGKCGALKSDDECVGSEMVAATESVRLPLTSRPPLPVVSAWVKKQRWS
jgi:hypothetical protein